jgi:hypothetical protein
MDDLYGQDDGAASAATDATKKKNDEKDQQCSLSIFKTYRHLCCHKIEASVRVQELSAA